MDPMINTDLDTREYIRKHYMITSLVVIFGIWAILTLISFIGIFPSFVLIICMIFGSYHYAIKKADQAFMHEFAAKNNFSYSAGAQNLISSPAAYLSMMGHGQFITQNMTGMYGSYPIHMYTFHTTIGEDKGSHPEKFTVLEVDYPGDMKEMLLNSHHHEFDSSILHATKLELEGNFNKYFSLSVEKGTEVEALEIFTPDIMEALIEKSRMYSLEFIHNKLFIYADREVQTVAELNSLYEFAQFLITKLAPKLHI